MNGVSVIDCKKSTIGKLDNSAGTTLHRIHNLLLTPDNAFFHRIFPLLRNGVVPELYKSYTIPKLMELAKVVIILLTPF